MDAERVRAFLLKLPYVVETLQWGDNLVFWVGDKAIGGKMFVLANLEADSKGVISYAAGPTRFAELVEIEGLFPAPYFARAKWIAAHRWDALQPREWEQELRGAYDITLAKLPPKTRKILALSKDEQQKLIAERRALLERSTNDRPPKPKVTSAPDLHRTGLETTAGTQRSRKPPMPSR